ncbi:MAG: DNA recombination protein RmuC [Candidatus Zixiibacteriota bacterium]|nr:MAG: DNA recombination protein RmuC [candidate division Zixibacteria bacterium]
MEYLIFGSAVVIILVLLLILMQRQLASLREQVRRSLENTDQIVSQRLETASRAVSDVQTNLARLEESNKRIFEVGKDISSLQEILRAPKIRGGLGEFLLSDLLSQILPAKHYSLPHAFKSGERVDAVIHLAERLVPVDSKFPLENFRKLLEADTDRDRKVCRRRFISDVKSHINAIAEKYIVPDEGTLPFALMYIPAENVYYETIVKDQDAEDGKSVADYSMQKRVIPVSPNTFYLYLQTIMLGLKGLEVEKNAREIISALGRLRVDFGKFARDFELIRTHLRHANVCFDSADRKRERFEERLKQVASPPSEDQDGAVSKLGEEDQIRDTAQ